MCCVPDWFDQVTVSPSVIVSVDGVKQNAGPPQSAGIVTTGSPAAPAVDAGRNAITRQARAAEATAMDRRTELLYGMGARRVQYPRYFSYVAGVGIACAQTIWRN